MSRLPATVDEEERVEGQRDTGVAIGVERPELG
jgi:hypothetical protein